MPRQLRFWYSTTLAAALAGAGAAAFSPSAEAAFSAPNVSILGEPVLREPVPNVAVPERPVQKPPAPKVAARKPVQKSRAASAPPVRSKAAPKPLPSGTTATADFGTYQPRSAVRGVADWAVASNDHGRGAFFILDKPRARLYVFDPRGHLMGTAPVLLGLALGDDSVPGIGEKDLADIAPKDRTTPAGRFVAERGVNAQGEDVTWVDYAAAVSLHRVRPLKPEERRLERLASTTWTDNRISYGCINVPVNFYNSVVQQAWKSGSVVIYVMPDTRPLDAVLPRTRSFMNASALLRKTG